MTSGPPDTDRSALLAEMYEAFNRRDIDAVLARLHPTVVWPNGWEGGIVRGHDAVRDYWTRQWSEVSPNVTPEGFEYGSDGALVVHVRQVIRTPAGKVMSDLRLQHVYRFRDGLVVSMAIHEVP